MGRAIAEEEQASQEGIIMGTRPDNTCQGRIHSPEYSKVRGRWGEQTNREKESAREVQERYTSYCLMLLQVVDNDRQHYAVYSSSKGHIYPAKVNITWMDEHPDLRKRAARGIIHPLKYGADNPKKRKEQ